MRLIVALTVLVILCGCGGEPAKTDDPGKPAKLVDIDADFFTCKVPEGFTAEKVSGGIDITGAGLTIGFDELVNTNTPRGIQAATLINIYAPDTTRSLATYNGIQYADCYTKGEGKRNLFYVTGDRLYKIEARGEEPFTADQEKIFGTLSFKQTGEAFNMEFFLGIQPDPEFEFDPNTGKKVPTGTLPKPKDDKGNGGSPGGMDH
jgi:hypothetical protein